MQIGTKTFDTKRHTYVMGILNVTPDSFSDGGKWCDKDIILRRASEMIQEGADLLDVGGESTRPGHIPVTAEEEMERVVPVVELLRANFEIPISVDTYKSVVAEETLKAGANLINDIWGFKWDEQMASVVQKYQAACCLMHNRETMVYGQFLKDVMEDLKESIAIAKAAGMEDDKIMLDPGIGFAKTYEMNLEVMRNLSEFQKLGYPILLGTSRKSMIGLALDLPVTEREEGTLVTTVMAVQGGCGFVRVHDVMKNKRAIQMTEAIIKR